MIWCEEGWRPWSSLLSFGANRPIVTIHPSCSSGSFNWRVGGESLWGKMKGSEWMKVPGQNSSWNNLNWGWFNYLFSSSGAFCIIRKTGDDELEAALRARRCTNTLQIRTAHVYAPVQRNTQSQWLSSAAQDKSCSLLVHWNGMKYGMKTIASGCGAIWTYVVVVALDKVRIFEKYATSFWRTGSTNRFNK